MTSRHSSGIPSGVQNRGSLHVDMVLMSFESTGIGEGENGGYGLYT